MSSAGGESTAAGHDRPRTRAALAALALVTALGLLVRLVGLDYALPLFPLGDGSVPVAQVEMLRAGKDPADAGLDAAFYPFLLAHAVALLPPEIPESQGPPRDLAEHVSLAGSPWREVRFMSALLSMLAVPATWLLARRFVGDGWAVLAAAFLAGSLLHVDFSSQERPHGLVTTTTLFAILAAIRLRRKADVGSYLLAGLTAGLAIGSLQSGAAVLPAILVAVLLQERGAKRASRWWLCAVLAIVAAFVVWLYPYHFKQREAYFAPVEEHADGLFNLAGHEVFLGQFFSGYGFRRILETLWSYDPLMLGAIALGLAWLAIDAWRRRSARGAPSGPDERSSATRAVAEERRALRLDACVVLGHALPYLLVNGMYLWTLERFVMPLQPALACVAAFGVRRAVETATPRGKACRRAGVALAASLAGIAALPAVQLARVRAAPPVEATVAAWVEEHLAPEERIVAVPYVDIPVFHAPEALLENGKRDWASFWVKYQKRLSPAEIVGARHQVLLVPSPRLEALEALRNEPIAYFRRSGADYVSIAIEPGESFLTRRALRELRAHGERVVRATPFREDDGLGGCVLPRHTETITEGPIFVEPYALTLFRYQRMGWVTEVYRLPREDAER